jgi:hypothetical protein
MTMTYIHIDTLYVHSCILVCVVIYVYIYIDIGMYGLCLCCHSGYYAKFKHSITPNVLHNVS